MQTYTLHTHTIGFDGQNSIQDMVVCAKKLGFKMIGISNHFIVNPIIKNSKMYFYAMRGGYENMYAASFEEAIYRFKIHYEELNNVIDENRDIKILRGMEVDFFQDVKWINGFEKAISLLKPDYLIGAAHFVLYSGKLFNVHDLENADAKTQDDLLKIYWTNVARAAKTGLFDWMAHLDLPKKVGLGRGDKWIEFENNAVEQIAESNTAVEINTSFYRPYCYEPYPSNRILKMVAKNDIPVLISDDAHKTENIGRHFDEAENLIQQFNLKRYAR